MPQWEKIENAIIFAVFNLLRSRLWQTIRIQRLSDYLLSSRKLWSYLFLSRRTSYIIIIYIYHYYKSLWILISLAQSGTQKVENCKSDCIFNFHPYDFNKNLNSCHLWLGSSVCDIVCHLLRPLIWHACLPMLTQEAYCNSRSKAVLNKTFSDSSWAVLLKR